MTTGTKSLLFGVHQFIWHPFTVALAWWKLYSRPTFRELLCIIIHDWGYWGSPNMDDERGENHPRRGAVLAMRLCGGDLRYFNLVLYHSRHLARRHGAEPSRLCWADKLSIIYEPAWFYLLRARLSGELREYRAVAAAAGTVPAVRSNRLWFLQIQVWSETLAREQRPNAVPYSNAGPDPSHQSDPSNLQEAI